MTTHLEIDLIDEVSVRFDGQAIPLPTSRKTLALMAYLLITGRPHRREHLCDLFFSEANDPKGSLRWSLTKLRPILNLGAERLLTPGASVLLDCSEVLLDVDFVHAVHDAQMPTTDNLRLAAGLLSATPFLGLELARGMEFGLWLSGEREQLQSLRPRVFQSLVASQDCSDQEAVKWLRTWLRLDLYSHDAPRLLAKKLTELGLPNEAATVTRDYVSLMGEEALPAPPSAPKEDGIHQTIGFCKASDGVKIAYATVGSGPPLVKAANWLNHLELDWDSPIWGDTFRALAREHTFIRYDERGNGMSDWDAPEISFDAFVEDLESVVDHLRLKRFPLLGLSQGCAVSIDYAVRHPQRVSALILVSGYAAGWRIGLSKEEQEQREAVLTLTRHGWGTSNPAYRHIFSQTFMPDADSDRLAWFDEFQRNTTSPENAVRFQEAFGDIDVRHLLPKVQVPTLVIHARDDQRIPLSCGRELATEIPNAKFITLDSKSHIILGDEPAWDTCMREISRFLANLPE
jgi:pimeloyl-ACP methyl ester carboxylesterase